MNLGKLFINQSSFLGGSGVESTGRSLYHDATSSRGGVGPSGIRKIYDGLVGIVNPSNSSRVPSRWNKNLEHYLFNQSKTLKTIEIAAPTSLDYRSSMWGRRRISLDGISNHLPFDSKASNTFVLFLQNGNWLDLTEVDPGVKIDCVVMGDNGCGYYYEGALGMMDSDGKAGEMSVGQFGEGLKMIAAAALRSGEDLTYQSQNWRAKPYKKKVKGAQGSDKERLCFKIEETDQSISGSRTIINNPSQELLEELLAIRKQTLFFRDNVETVLMEKDYSNGGYNRKVLELPEGEVNQVYVKGVVVEELPDAIFSYDISTNKISPDRQNVSYEELLTQIQCMIFSEEYALQKRSRGESVEVLKKIILKSIQDPENYFFELRALDHIRNGNQLALGSRGMNQFSNSMQSFQSSPFGLLSKKVGPTVKTAAVLAFEELFGKKELPGVKVVLASNQDVLNKDAELMGFKVVRVHRNLRDFLKQRGVPTADQVAKEDFVREYILVEDLTVEEKQAFDLAKEIDKVLKSEGLMSENTQVNLRIFSRAYLPTSGREVKSELGYNILGTSEIAIKREVLADPIKFLDVYIHEIGHLITGADDYDRKFVNFFTRALAVLMSKMLRGELSGN